MAVGLAQRRSRATSYEGTGETAIGSDVSTIADEVGEACDADHATVWGAADVAVTSPDSPSNETATGEDTNSTDAPRTAEIARLGKAAMDGQSREVPVPQPAFNQRFLAHSAEAFWGIRDRDDAVLVSQDFDAVHGRDGEMYVGSSEIGDDVRKFPVPTAVLNYWTRWATAPTLPVATTFCSSRPTVSRRSISCVSALRDGPTTCRSESGSGRWFGVKMCARNTNNRRHPVAVGRVGRETLVPGGGSVRITERAGGYCRPRESHRP